MKTPDKTQTIKWVVVAELKRADDTVLLVRNEDYDLAFVKELPDGYLLQSGPFSSAEISNIAHDCAHGVLPPGSVTGKLNALTMGFLYLAAGYPQISTNPQHRKDQSNDQKTTLH